MFDTFVHFQNSCDQDYDYKEWGDITYFKKQIEFIKSMTKEQFTKWYKENILQYQEYMQDTVYCNDRRKDDNGEYRGRILNCINMIDISNNRHAPMQTPDQVDYLRQVHMITKKE